LLVATPGRLLDLQGRQSVALDEIEILVLDEADRMVDMGFAPDLRRILKLLPKDRQTLMFSATMPPELNTVASEALNKPQRLEIDPPKRPASSIEQAFFPVAKHLKTALLDAILRRIERDGVIVFTRTKHGANKVAENLEKAGHRAEAIHGNKSQNARQRALEEFRQGRSRILVATDIAARGIDIDDVTHVVNFELPDVAESYVHRIGRTARAGSAGIAIAFCDPSERSSLKAIERLVKQDLTVMAGERYERPAKPEPGQRPGRFQRHERGHGRHARSQAA
jgi:ATP-dependent RNA helicase RhlE